MKILKKYLCILFSFVLMLTFCCCNKNTDLIASTRIIDSNFVIINEEPIPSSSGYFEDNELSEVLKMINELRISNGLEFLYMDDKLCEYADIRVEEIKIVWSHTRPNGEQGYDLINKNKYAGENLAKGYYNHNDVFNAWVESPSHLDNMLFSQFTRIGLAYNDGYWAMMLSS